MTKKIINIKECNNCIYKEYKNSATPLQKTAEVKKKSKKLAKLERDRYSVFTDDLEHCILCGNKKDHLHEIFFGRNRIKSMELDFVIPLCFSCHEEMHRNHEWQEFWRKQGQLYFEKNIGSREDFISVFGKSYLSI